MAGGRVSEEMFVEPAASADFSLLPEDMARDVEASLISALDGGAVLPGGHDPLTLFRRALGRAIRDLESERGQLLRRFLEIGPYNDGGEIPPEAEEHLSDAETAAAVAFIHGRMVTAFQGSLAELLAAGPCLRLAEELKSQGQLPREARLFGGEAVRAGVPGRSGTLQAADFHLLIESAGTVTVVGLAEVKSYRQSPRRFRAQLDRHHRRAVEGLTVCGHSYPSSRIRMGRGNGQPPIRIRIGPGRWKLPRSFHFEEGDGRSRVHIEPPTPPPADELMALGPDLWRITLRWSHEALAAAAFEVSFWYMEKVGEALYAEGVPREWSEMSPAEAGRNAAKMMLYSAILRARTRAEESRAIALYNTYGFGYALGANFRNSRGRREMLWFEDLLEVLTSGRTKEGCRIVQPRAERPPASC